MPSGIYTLNQYNQAKAEGAIQGSAPVEVSYLVVAGGGGGGGANGGGGGGGGGGLLQGSSPIASGTSYTVTVGGGGPAGATNARGTSGINSIFGSITSIGGGGGGCYATALKLGIDGGSGGGGGSGPENAGAINAGGQGTAEQGNRGGSGGFINNQYMTGGGGGAGTRGMDYTNLPGNGGAGIASDISGTRTAYTGGGGGGSENVIASGVGGAGGGGTGGSALPTSSTAGGVNTGGGGGGGGSTSQAASAGGSGIVIVSYPDIYQAASATTGSPTISTSGSGSVDFSGTSQYLSTPSNSGFNFGTGDFTIEFWVNSDDVSNSTQKGVFQTSDTAGGLKTTYTTGVHFNFGGAGDGGLAISVGGTAYFSAAGLVSTSTWYHIAITRAAGVVNLWLNGTSVATGVGNITTLSGTYCAIGGYYNSAYLLNGRVSNFRVVKGTALYTATFTPSTIPLTAIANTQILLGTNSGAQFVDSSTNSLILTATGTPTWDSSSPFATGLGYKNRVYKWTSSGSITF